MRVLTDNPITTVEDDSFGFKDYAEILAQTIIETDRLPFCIGIFGSWGTGKTSLMNLIKEIIEKEQNYKTIFFNPWKYDNKEDVWNALLQSILYNISNNTEGQIKDKALKLAKETAWQASKRLLPMLTGGVINPADLEKVKDILSGHDSQYYEHINKFESNFEKLIAEYVGENGKLVVFVDDLDRCLPENAIMILESLKLYIGNSKCIFVIGMDNSIVESGIRYKYKDDLHISGQDYLDKIIQVPFFLPPVSFERLRDSFQFVKTLVYSEAIWRLLEVGFERNPRRIKRFINGFYFLQDILIGSAQSNADTDAILKDKTIYIYLAKLMIFQMRFPSFYSYLKKNPDKWWILENQIISKKFQEFKESILKELPSLKPFIEDDNLIDFMKGTRDESFYKDPPDKEVVSMLINTVGLTISDNNPLLINAKMLSIAQEIYEENLDADNE